MPMINKENINKEKLSHFYIPGEEWNFLMGISLLQKQIPISCPKYTASSVLKVNYRNIINHQKLSIK